MNLQKVIIVGFLMSHYLGVSAEFNPVFILFVVFKQNVI